MIIDSVICLIVGGLYIYIFVAYFDVEAAIWSQQFMIIRLITGLLWLLSGVLTLIFVVSGRHARYEKLWNEKRANAEVEAMAVVIEFAEDLPIGIEGNEEGAADATLDASEPSAAQKPT
jgi:hypothetical protein